MKNTTLTEYQKEFLFAHFFKNDKYAGWRNIATKLLENGSCIVAGTECIWNGGIGNFIKVETAKDAVDCLLYKFDLKYFLDSKWYEQISDQYITNLIEKKTTLEEELSDICTL